MSTDSQNAQTYLFKLQGYLMKARDSFESLPSNNAYSKLSSLFYKSACFDDGIHTDQVTPALNGIARIASHNALYIEQRSGVPARRCKSKLTDEEIGLRIDVLYSHRKDKPLRCENFSDDFERDVRNMFSKVESKSLDMFFEESKQALNEYFYDNWLSKSTDIYYPNRDDDLKKLNTLLKQTEKIIDEIPLLIEMVIDNDCIDCYFDKEDIKKHIPVIWKLFFCTKEAIDKIQSSKGDYKQLQVSLIAELACNYRVYLKLKPSTDETRGQFMDFISLVEDEIDRITKQTRKKNRFGRQMVSRAIKK